MDSGSPIEEIASAVLRLRVACLKAGMKPPVSIELANHDDMMRLRHLMTPAMMFENADFQKTQIAGVAFVVDPLREIRAALRDAAAHLVGGAAAYRRHGRRRHTLKPRAETDPLFTQRADDFDMAAQRAIRAVQRYA